VPLAELAAPAGVAPAALPVPVLLAGAVLVPLLGVVVPELEPLLDDEPDMRPVPLLELLPYPPDPLVEEPLAVVSVWQAASMPAASAAATVACRSRMPCIWSLLRWMGYRTRRHMPCRATAAPGSGSRRVRTRHGDVPRGECPVKILKQGGQIAAAVPGCRTRDGVTPPARCSGSS
jgi:hypothetical protein